MDQPKPWLLFGALLSGTFIMIEAAAFQAPAMPSITRHFGIPVNQAALILLFYYLGATVFAPIMGRLADQIGRRRMVLIGMGVFAAAEFLASFSPTFAVFLGARFIQGLGVACVLPVVLSFANLLFTEDKRGTALGFMTFAMTMGAVTGGLLGGLLIDRFGWQSIYWVSGTLTLAGMGAIVAFVPDIRSKQPPKPFDLAGSLCLLFCVGTLLSVPTLAGNFGMGSPYTIAALVAGIVGVIVLWRIESKAEAPAVDLAILANRAFGLPAAIHLMHVLTFTGMVYTMAFFISGRAGGSASQVGFVNLFVYGSSLFMSPVAGWLADRLAPRSVISFALGMTVVGLYMFSTISADTPMWFIVCTVTLLGMMISLKTPAIMKLALSTVPAHKIGSGSGLLSMLRDLGTPTGTSFSLALFGASFAAQTKVTLETRARAIGLDESLWPALAQAAKSKGKDVVPELTQALQRLGQPLEALLRSANSEALSSTLPTVGSAMMTIAATAFLLCLFLPRGKVIPKKNGAVIAVGQAE